MALDRDTVVRAALRLLDEVGLHGLSLRRVAGELNVQAPALYWHFKNKQELLDEMATTAFADNMDKVELPGPGAPWQEWTTAYGKGLRQILLGYRDGAKLLSGTYLTDNKLFAPMETALRTFTDAGFTLHDALSGLSTIYCYAVGFTIEQQAAYPRPGERNEQYEPKKRAERIDAQKFPLALAVGEELFSKYDERFAEGLATIIRGLDKTNPLDT